MQSVVYLQTLIAARLKQALTVDL